MATVPYVFDCTKESGFVMDPNEHKRVGYVTALKLGGTEFDTDLTISAPFNNGATPTGMTGLQRAGRRAPLMGKVVGVVEKFEWNGGMGDSLRLDFYVSQQNATEVKSLQQSALSSTKVAAFSWWIVDYDQETKLWYEASYPIGGPVGGTIVNKGAPELDVDLTPVSVKEGIDLAVYKISMAVVPRADMRYSLHFANSSSNQIVKSWGLDVGRPGAPGPVASS